MQLGRTLVWRQSVILSPTTAPCPVLVSGEEHKDKIVEEEARWEGEDIFTFSLIITVDFLNIIFVLM